MDDKHSDQLPASPEAQSSKMTSALASMSQTKPDKTVIAEDMHDFVDNSAASVLLDRPRSSRILLWGVVCFVLIAIVWAYFAELDEITRGQGSVIPSQQIQLL